MTSETTGISVTGVGRATATPDLARLSLGVSVRGVTVTEASALARDRSSALLEALESCGVDKADIATTNYSVFADHDHPKGKERLLGYRVTNEVQVTVRDLARLGATIDDAVEAGGDAASVNRLVFDVDDDTATRDLAREAAWEDARRKAAHLAQLAGRELGPAERIAETTGGAPSPRMLAAPMAVAESTPIEAGTSTITVTLDVRFSI